jgi:thioredoxin-like negative regulator of GroEL
MTDKELTLDDVLAQIERFSTAERLQVMEKITAVLRRDLDDTPPTPRKSLYGIFAHLGPGPSDEDIDEIRREMWSNFPREDII